ncbi:glycosyl hydrolase family 3 N terminal domain-containing protein [Drepanopeziza brunnea f. sp. 'multigermtubi' MB_m1]|uniref:beta-glucosidase n=1 Tax=Marssonina brunnea f. sp. multigermtubi (strain MB_m1) TaxID=1072389 RepID=K1X0D2_MARBU|nr:glycosyl hydrolase family 3 N terminal domain-containing protein [Drepanopeziza brunnea f. sp. 'multigermtubi' MB_m1]EKD18442.1 glycosyl hydrolase family 3 N terminal domain-containing protein [Drepanopeziza brunnea f. sp. 'multigermtubi' MB_m1]
MAESPDSQIIDPIFDNYAQKSGELSSGNMNHMPVLEFSPPDSPVAKHISGDQTRYPRKESPAFKTSDGPNGARGAIFKAGTKAALFPCGVSLAASWNKDLLFQVLLAPTVPVPVCLHRGPLGGRNFESFSEDPFLDGKLAASYINGLQGGGTAATIKHFVANEQETERLKIDSIIYTRATSFEERGDMKGRYTILEVPEVICDWGGTNCFVESIEHGCDIAILCVDSMAWRENLEAAAANILRLVERTKGGDMSAEALERDDDREETRLLIRNAGVEERRRTIAYQAISRIAVTGLNATRAIAGGGGSAFLNPYYITLPLDSIRAVAEQNVSFAIGCQTYKWLPLAAEYCATAVGDPGVTLEFFLGDEFDGEPKVVQHRTNTDLFLWDSVPLEVGNVWSCRARTTLTPQTTGLHMMSFSSVGAGRFEGLYIGYRHYQHLKLTPLFPFGHGLSYTTFTYGTPTISHAVLSFAPDSRLTVSIPVTNSGSVPGTGMVQAYIHDPKSPFAKVWLQPGKTKDALLSLDEYPVGYWDTDAGECIVEEGIFEVLIGASSADIRYSLLSSLFLS